MNKEDIPCYCEIVTHDTYRLRSLDFEPDVIFDIGANLGVFTNFARELFPRALIVAIEPHPANFIALQASVSRENVVLLEKAIGTGQIWRYPDVRNDDDSQTTTGETYISAGSGYSIPDIGGHPLSAVATEGVMLDALYEEYVQPGRSLLVKIDCEGAENVLFVHPPSVEVLRKADYITMELHPYWATRTPREWARGQVHEDFEAVAARVEGLLSDTHVCTSEQFMFYARKQ